MAARILPGGNCESSAEIPRGYGPRLHAGYCCSGRVSVCRIRSGDNDWPHGRLRRPSSAVFWEP